MEFPACYPTDVLNIYMFPRFFRGEGGGGDFLYLFLVVGVLVWSFGFF